MKIDVVIIEDEPLLAGSLRRLIAEVNPDCSIVAGLTSIEDSVAWLNQHPEPCLIFMDIQLADGICFSIFEKANVSNKAIVFTTAYDEYVLNAFEYNSLAYLLKPIKKEDIQKVFGKVEKVLGTIDQFQQQELIQKYKQLANAMGNNVPRYRQRLLINKVDGFIQVPVNSIACIQVEEKVAWAYTFSGQAHALDSTLEKLEEELDPDLFFRANRQVILHIDAIVRVENYFNGKLILLLRKEIPNNRVVVSRKKAGLLKTWIDR